MSSRYQIVLSAGNKYCQFVGEIVSLQLQVDLVSESKVGQREEERMEKQRRWPRRLKLQQLVQIIGRPTRATDTTSSWESWRDTSTDKSTDTTDNSTDT